MKRVTRRKRQIFFKKFCERFPTGEDADKDIAESTAGPIKLGNEDKTFCIKMYNEYLVESGISCEYMEKEKQIKIFIQTEGNQYELRMKFPQYYPYEFPEIYIEDQKELCIPHLYTDNKLCLYDTNEVLPNPERYREEALESVRRAKDLLVSSEKQENIIDYQIEAISFWDAKATGKIDYLGSGNTDTHLLWSCEWLDGSLEILQRMSRYLV